MGKNYKETAEQIMNLLGGKKNILSYANCMTRLRVDVLKLEDTNQELLKKMEEISGIQLVGNQIQLILGPGRVNKVTAEMKELLGFEGNTIEGDELRAEWKQQNVTPFKLLLKKISSIFIPILPAIIACGLVMGLNNIAMKIHPGYAASSLGLMMAAMGNAAFAVLPVFVGISTAKVFGGSPYLGGTMASLLTLPALANMTLFGMALTPGRGGIIAVLMVVIFASWLERQLHKWMPDALDTFCTPLLTILLAGFAALLLLQPLGGILSDGFTSGVRFALEKGGVATGAMMSIMWLPLVMTGLHHSITPLHAELIEAIGYTPLLPIFAMVGPGQIGAVLYVYSKTKSNRLKKVILGGIPVQIMGVGEPLIYGVTLPLFKPFLAACLSAGIGGALCVAVQIHSLGMGLSGLPLAMMLNKPLMYVGIMLLVGVASFFLTKLLGFTDVED